MRSALTILLVLSATCANAQKPQSEPHYTWTRTYNVTDPTITTEIVTFSELRAIYKTEIGPLTENQLVRALAFLSQDSDGTWYCHIKIGRLRSTERSRVMRHEYKHCYGWTHTRE